MQRCRKPIWGVYIIFLQLFWGMGRQNFHNMVVLMMSVYICIYMLCYVM